MWELSQKNDKGKAFIKNFSQLSKPKQKMIDFISKQRESGLWFKGKRVMLCKRKK